MSQRRQYELPKLVRKPKFLPLLGSRWSYTIYDPFHHHYRSLTLREWHVAGKHLAEDTRGSFKTMGRTSNESFLTSNVTIPKAKMSDSRVERPDVPSVPMLKSSGAIHRWDPLNLAAEVSVQLRPAMLVRPKSPRRARPDLSTRILS